MSTKETSQPGNAKKANSSSFIISISLFAIITAVILFKDEEFSMDIEANTSKQCCFHFESVTNTKDV